MTDEEYKNLDEAMSMNPSEFAEYIKENPEVGREYAKKTMDILEPVLQQSADAMSKVVNDTVRDAIQQVIDTQRSIYAMAMSIAQKLAGVPELPDADQLDKAWAEIELLEPFLNAEIKKYPQYEGQVYIDVLDTLPLTLAMCCLVMPTAESANALDQTVEGIEPEQIQTVKVLLTVRDLARMAREATANALILESSILGSEYFPMHHGHLTDILALYDSRSAQYTKQGDAIIQTPTGAIQIRGARDRKGGLGVNSHKLLCVAVSEFTKHNHFSRSNKTRTFNRSVSIPFNEYARQSGYKIDIQPTETEEEAQKEKKRAQNQRKLARRRINEDLKTLGAIYMEYRAGKKNKSGEEDIIRLNLIEAEGIVGDFIHIAFTQTAAQILSRYPLMQYPRTLLGISANSRSAYKIAYKMAMHYYNDNNIAKGTRGRLSIPVLIEWSELPTYEELQESDNARHWEDRIKEPLENALDVMTANNSILSWEYVKAKGIKLSDQEAQSISTYEAFSRLYIDFELIGEPEGQEERRQRRAKEKEEALKKQPKKKKTTTQKRGCGVNA